MSNKVIKLIKKSPIFYDLLDKEIEEIIHDCSIVCYEKNDLILEKGKKSQDLIIVIDGDVELKRGDNSWASLGPGSVFGELILLNEDLQAVDVRAHSEEVHILEIPYLKIHKFYAQEIRIYGILMANLAKMLAKRLKKAGEIINKIKSN